MSLSLSQAARRNSGSGHEQAGRCRLGSCSGSRTAAFDPHALGGDPCGEQRGRDPQHCTTPRVCVGSTQQEDALGQWEAWSRYEAGRDRQNRQAQKTRCRSNRRAQQKRSIEKGTMTDPIKLVQREMTEAIKIGAEQVDRCTQIGEEELKSPE